MRDKLFPRYVFAWLATFVLIVSAHAADLNRAPINYAKAPAHNAVSRLQERLAAGKAKLVYDDDRGYLKSLLKELNVPESSQTLVFSKTSLQRERISPKTPRAIYFNDDVYVGFCLRGGVLELSAVDPNLGTVFYTLDQEPADKPRFTRQTDNCLLCHGSTLNRGLPGHLVRSVFTDTEGLPILSAGSYRTDHSSPLDKRWGGWYVTGTHGRQNHMGNWAIHDKHEMAAGHRADGQNLTQLKDSFTTSFYLTPHSDIVALMVLEHQAEMHNRLTRALFDTRLALFDEQELNKALGERKAQRFDSTTSRIKNAGESLVKYMLFCEECSLTQRVRGTSSFTKDFAATGPRDDAGRSLRDLDLNTRLFRYPCSYLIYSEAFDKLPAETKEYVWRRLFDVLTGKDTSDDFAHLSKDDRLAIFEILRDTKPDLPAYWIEKR